MGKTAEIVFGMRDLAAMVDEGDRVSTASQVRDGEKVAGKLGNKIDVVEGGLEGTTSRRLKLDSKTAGSFPYAAVRVEEGSISLGVTC